MLKIICYHETEFIIDKSYNLSLYFIGANMGLEAINV